MCNFSVVNFEGRDLVRVTVLSDIVIIILAFILHGMIRDISRLVFIFVFINCSILLRLHYARIGFTLDRG